MVRYTFDHTGKTVNIVNFNTDRSQILGVSTASYTANSKTKTKNRLSGAAATGYLAQNLLNNSGLEQANTTGYSWAAAVSEQSSQVNTALRNSITEVSPAVKPHTGNSLMKTYIYGGTETMRSIPMTAMAVWLPLPIMITVSSSVLS